VKSTFIIERLNLEGVEVKSVFSGRKFQAFMTLWMKKVAVVRETFSNTVDHEMLGEIHRLRV